jgi:hypothetical protein
VFEYFKKGKISYLKKCGKNCNSLDHDIASMVYANEIILVAFQSTSLILICLAL